MIDANQRWDVAEAISWVTRLAEFKPLWIEEPTCPDDILGHATIAKVLQQLHSYLLWLVDCFCLDQSFCTPGYFLFALFRNCMCPFQALAPHGIGVATGEQVSLFLGLILLTPVMMKLVSKTLR